VGRIPEHLVQEVRSRADIVGLIARHVTLTKKGARYWGLCPFHSEKTASFSVNPERQVFHCFGCGTGGDIFSFRMLVEGLEFPEAVRVIAAEVGVTIQESAPGDPGRTAQLVKANDVALAYFRDALRSAAGGSARAYLERRHVPIDLVERFEVGYAPAVWDGTVGALRRAGISEELGEKAGLLAPRQTGEGWYDRFRDRVVFPIRDSGGRLVGFGGRSLDPDAPKYLNSPETPLYRKAHALFGLPHAVDGFRERDQAVVVEGYFDVLALEQAGVRGAVAPCGTALTADHARRLRRYVREVVLVFDGDEAGRRAAERALVALLEEGLRVRGVFLPRGEDPASLVAAGREGLLRDLVEKAEPLLDQFLDAAVTPATEHAWGASDAVGSLAPYLRALGNPVERHAYARALAARLGVPPEAVLDAMQQTATRAPQKGSESLSKGSSPVLGDSITRILIAVLASEPELAQRVTESHVRALPSREAQELLERLLSAIHSYGGQAFSHLLSPEEGELRADLKSALSQIVSESLPLEPAVAQQALQDCLNRLERRALDRQSEKINARLKACADPEEERALLQEKQEMLNRRRSLLSEESRS
jgi:DNA primase